jgi:regulator of sigma E protease
MVVVAGPIMNYVLGFIIFLLVFLAWGKPIVSGKPVIGEIITGMPADKAGIKKNDLISKIDTAQISSWEDLAEKIHLSAGKKITITIVRSGLPYSFEITPELYKKSNMGIIGIMPSTEEKAMGVFESIKESGYQVYFFTVFPMKYLYEKLKRMENPDIAGPVGIIQVVSKVAKNGIKELLFLIGLISVSVGWFNLIPISPLDGGHVVLYLYEGISRKKLDKRLVRAATIVGFAFVIFIIIVATCNDIIRIRSGFWK